MMKPLHWLALQRLVWWETAVRVKIQKAAFLGPSISKIEAASALETIHPRIVPAWGKLRQFAGRRLELANENR
jgi:hypothetical protein